MSGLSATLAKVFSHDPALQDQGHGAGRGQGGGIGQRVDVDRDQVGGLPRFHRPDVVRDAQDPRVVPGGGDDGLAGSYLFGDQAEFFATVRALNEPEVITP